MRTIDDMPRERAVNRINEKRNLALNVIVYLVMNAVFVAGWAPNAGQPLPGGFFWPIIPIVAWGTGLLIYGYHVLGGANSTKSQ
ncbi:MAG: 2TM domain-containing protein [Candidatus Limnocylindria bacterium]